MRFDQFIIARSQNPPNTLEGDFIQDAMHDLPAIRKCQSWAALKRHLWRLSACDGAIEAARNVWKEFQQTPGAPRPKRAPIKSRKKG